MGAERRKSARFLTRENTFAAIRSGFKKVGKVRDISFKGLSFSYLTETAQDDDDRHSFQVNIFSSKNWFYLSNVPCRIVYDILDSTFDQGLFIQMNRCGLHFEKLSKTQSDLLELFITKHTAGVLSS